MSAIAHSVQMDNICRTCLSEEQNMKSVFDNDFSSGETLQLFQMLMACTSVQVAEDDGLPAQICLSCINCIARSFTFKRLCENSDSTLRELLRKSTIIDAAELKPSADVQFYTQATLDGDIDTDMLDIQMKFEAGETVIYDPISGSEWTDCERDDIKMMKNVDDSETQTIACANNNPETDRNIEENQMPDESDQTIYPCDECTACFMLENDLKIHSHTHRKLPKRKLPTRKCTVNRQELASSNQLQSDRNLPSDVNVTYPCTQCEKNFKHPSKLKQHLATHSGVKPFACNVCDKRFRQSSHRNDHMLGHNDERNYTCAECGMSFLRRRNLLSHQRRYVGIAVHTCSVTGQQTCDVTRHMYKEVKDHVCSYCGKGFGAARSLRVHERRHTGEKPYTCTVCNKGFSDRSAWIVHARVHSGERPYACDMCDKRCISSSHLSKHKKMHTGEKPHRCHLCAKAFLQSYHLRMHIKRHTGKQDHICVYCKKGFHRAFELKVHLRVHTGEKPYSCKICHKSFAQMASLSYHLKTTSH